MQTSQAKTYLNILAERLFRVKVLHARIEEEFGVRWNNENMGAANHTNRSKEDIAISSFPITSDFVHSYAVENLNLSTADIQNIVSRTIASVDHSESYFFIDYLLMVLETRLQIRFNKTIHENVNIISLGSYCIPRVMTSKWGLKLSRACGEPSLPFDLSVHPFDAVETLISNRFDDYLDEQYFLNLKMIRPAMVIKNRLFGRSSG